MADMTETGANGLSQAEAKQRLAQYGYNELPEEKRNPLLEFFSHFWGPIPWMIEAAAILSAVVRHWADFIIITVLLLANAVRRLLGGISGGQCHRRAQGNARA